MQSGSHIYFTLRSAAHANRGVPKIRPYLIPFFYPAIFLYTLAPSVRALSWCRMWILMNLEPSAKQGKNGVGRQSSKRASYNSNKNKLSIYLIKLIIILNKKLLSSANR
jgi:hypothetical protein